jgi:hypothetical protein
MNAKRPGPGVVEYAVVLALVAALAAVGALALVAALAAVGAAAALGVGAGDVLRCVGQCAPVDRADGGIGGQR